MDGWMDGWMGRVLSFTSSNFLYVHTRLLFNVFCKVRICDLCAARQILSILILDWK